MKISVVADLQCHAYAAFSRVLPSGRNSRLQHALDCLTFAAARAEGGVLIVLGDLFEDRHSLGIDVMDAVVATVQAVAPTLNRVYLVAGNHDQYYRDGSITSLRSFSSIRNVVVVDSFLSTSVDRVPVHMAAFCADVGRVRDWVRGLPAGGLLCIHQAVVGAKADGGFLYEKADALGLRDLRADEFEYTLLGHFHSPQSLSDRVHYVGSPYQIKMNEAGEEKRIAVLSTRATARGGGTVDSLEWVPVTCAPTFRRIAADDYDLLSQEEKDLHFWEVEGNIDHIPDNVRLKPVPKEAVVYSGACSSLDGAVRAWLEQRGRGDLVETALGYLNGETTRSQQPS